MIFPATRAPGELKPPCFLDSFNISYIKHILYIKFQEREFSIPALTQGIEALNALNALGLM